MSPFNSAELKDYVESLWEAGSPLTAGQIARLFRSGWLRWLMRENVSAYNEYIALRARWKELERQLAAQDAYLHGLILQAEELREKQRVRRRTLLAVENQLAAEVAACARWLKGLTTDDRARQACDLARDMEEITIPALYKRIEDGEVELAALDASVRHNTDQILLNQRQLAEITDRYRALQDLMQPLGI